MNKPWQLTVFQYMKKRLKIPYETTANILSDTLFINLPSTNKKKLSQMNRQGRAGFNQLGSGEAKKFYDEIINPIRQNECNLDGATALQDLCTYLEDENIELSKIPENINALSDDDQYKEYMMCFLVEALGRPENPNISTNNKKTPIRTLKLRNQNLNNGNPCIGRDGALERIHQALQQETVVIVSGMGGIGKTYLVDTYADKYKDDYKVKQRVVCEDSFTSYKDLICALKVDGIQNTDIDKDAVCSRNTALLNQLEEPTLIIFDNLDSQLDDFDLFRDILRNSQAHFLITTRKCEGFKPLKRLSLDSLDESSQIELFKESYGQPFRSQSEESAAKEICRLVDGHTLAIQLLGRVADDTTCSCLLEQMKNDPNDAFNNEVWIYKDDYAQQERISRFIEVILFDVSSLSSKQKDVLSFLSFIPLEGISRDFLTKYLIDSKILRSLEDSSWVIRNRENATVRLHPIIRQVIQNRLLSSIPKLRREILQVYADIDMVSRELYNPRFRYEWVRLVSYILDNQYITGNLRNILTSSHMRDIFAAIDEDVDLYASARLLDPFRENCLELRSTINSTTELNTIDLDIAVCDFVSLFVQLCPYKDVPSLADIENYTEYLKRNTESLTETDFSQFEVEFRRLDDAFSCVYGRSLTREDFASLANEVWKKALEIWETEDILEMVWNSSKAECLNSLLTENDLKFLLSMSEMLDDWDVVESCLTILLSNFTIAAGVASFPVIMLLRFYSLRLGDASAQYELGRCYANGYGVEQNWNEAFCWFHLAAEQNHMKAQFELALCYANGLGIRQDFKKSTEWFRKSAEQGFPSAQYYLGTCYATGSGIEQSWKEAVAWFRKAAEQGHKDALDELNRFS